MKIRNLFASIAVAAATAVVACGPVYAADWAAPNNNGGHIVLTDKACTLPDAPPGILAAFTYGRDGSMTGGCWLLSGATVEVLWFDDMQIVRYPAGAFVEVSADGAPATGESRNIRDIGYITKRCPPPVSGRVCL